VIHLLVILLFTVLQFLAGFGILNLCKIGLRPLVLIPIATLLGVGVFSIVPFLLQLAYVPLTATNIFVSLVAVCLALNLRSRKALMKLVNQLRRSRWHLELYELPFLLLIAFIVFLSAWRCFYFPPTPRDLTSGAEVIAEYAVKEKTMVNSVFTVDLSTTNNQFKPPFITCLQIIYKYAGFPFGQVWLTTVFVCFLLFLYQVHSLRLHKIIAGFLLLAFIAIPEMYGYTIMALFDYSNGVFFCISLYFLFEYFGSEQRKFLALSAILMGIATYVRSETLILAALIASAILFHHWRKRSVVAKTVTDPLYFLLPSVFVYLLTITIYIKLYLPSSYNVDSLLNGNLLNLAPFYNRLTDMTQGLLLGGEAVNYYGYFTYLFLIVLAVNAFSKEAWNRRNLNWLFAVFIVYAGVPLMGFLFPLYDLDNSTKRGLFKIFPLMLLFMANSNVLISLSKRIYKWERGSDRLS
jgi:hypothetical protein